ncbi:hypothetical protein H5410_020830 [Solanum commersonii]|uniref:Uncharacterized protein n=1 Tax=Solanum commersonii TaxID=4109 RepID=A0A9J5ZB10_SOLCO|nr:hypothetical protein H5410_020830 [Solanum commersonii]
MTEGFKRLNQMIERLETEKGKMTQHIHSLQERIRFLLGNTDQTIPLKSSPSYYKMDKTGVHSPTNVERAIVPARGTASPVQTVTGKDSSNPLMVDTLPKSVRILPSSFNTITETRGDTRKNYTRKSKARSSRFDHEDIKSRSDENDLLIDQFNRHYDPNEDNDSGMSFDSIALHNLDT